MKNIATTFFIIFLFSFNTISGQNKIAFNKYCNARFGYCIDYPKQHFIPQPESENGDGRIFKNKKGGEVENSRPDHSLERR